MVYEMDVYEIVYEIVNEIVYEMERVRKRESYHIYIRTNTFTPLLKRTRMQIHTYIPIRCTDISSPSSSFSISLSVFPFYTHVHFINTCIDHSLSPHFPFKTKVNK